MSGFLGMDPEQVRAHARRLHTASTAVDDLRERLDQTVRAVPWEGEDADAFRAGWEQQAAMRLSALGAELAGLDARLLGEADQQDVVSDQDGDAQGPATTGSTIPPSAAASTSLGYLHEDNPWIPDWLEDPAESLVSGLAQTASDAIGWGLDSGIDLLQGGLDRLGVDTDGIDQFQRDADHLGGILTDWATGERVPTLAELGAAALLTAGSAGVGVYEALTGDDTAFLDDRPGGIVHDVAVNPNPSQSPQTLQDLIVQNDALRMGNPGGALDAGQIGIQEVHSTGGGEPSYIVQIPPTEGAALSAVPDAYGGQGNSRDWGSNLRLVAGQEAAAVDDVQAAMAAAGIPPGANVMFVGHSQGGIVANQLAADSAFNNASGVEGSYNVTHAFSVGSPVQTVVPAQGSTQSVNVNHEFSLGTGGFGGDLIAATDLAGLQVDGGTLAAPNRHEVTLEPYPVTSLNPVPVLEANHDSVGPHHDPSLGYAGSVAQATGSDPTLSALQEDLTGVYLGEGTYVAESQVVTVGRGDP